MYGQLLLFYLASRLTIMSLDYFVSTREEQFNTLAFLLYFPKYYIKMSKKFIPNQNIEVCDNLDK